MTGTLQSEWLSWLSIIHYQFLLMCTSALHQRVAVIIMIIDDNLPTLALFHTALVGVC